MSILPTAAMGEDSDLVGRFFYFVELLQSRFLTFERVFVSGLHFLEHLNRRL